MSEEDLKGLGVNEGSVVYQKALPLTLISRTARVSNAKRSESFLLLRLLCRYKENEVAVGQTRRFLFLDLIASTKTIKGNRP